jgi:hypothetical protein
MERAKPDDQLAKNGSHLGSASRVHPYVKSRWRAFDHETVDMMAPSIHPSSPHHLSSEFTDLTAIGQVMGTKDRQGGEGGYPVDPRPLDCGSGSFEGRRGCHVERSRRVRAWGEAGSCGDVVE